jgi:ABC-type multidrug transport system fused ATPase/permease subunit
MRPKKYWTISKESLERFLDDLEQLINFVVIEFQRILFAENLWVTGAAFLSAFIGYWLIKWLPLWGLALITTTTVFLAPLVYIANQEFIDEQINQAGAVINEQKSQIRDLAAQHTNNATSTLRSYAGEYTKQAQDLINNARGKASAGSAGSTVSNSDFPNAPKYTTPEKAAQAQPAS